LNMARKLNMTLPRVPIMRFDYICFIYYSFLFSLFPPTFPFPFYLQGDFFLLSWFFLFVFFVLFPLASKNERKYLILVFVGQAYFTEYNNLQFHPFCRKQHNFILLNGWVKPPLCIYTTSSLSIHLFMDT
jgi:hypothetical protein